MVAVEELHNIKEASMPFDNVQAFIDQAEIRESKADKGEQYLVLQVYAKVFVTMKRGHPLLSELEASLGERLDFNDEAQIAGLKGRDLRASLLEISDSYGDRVTINDFRPIHPISENPNDTV